MVNNLNISAIIQARTGSSRLPNKTIEFFEGKTLLGHIIQRVKLCKRLDSIILATTSNYSDDCLSDIAKKEKILIYRGSEDDVLDRYYRAAKEFGTEIIVRITSDDPFKDPTIVDKAVDFFQKLQPEIDIVTNYLPPTYPEGLDIEVFSFRALETAWQEARKQSEREHVSTYIYKNSSLFQHFNFIHKESDLSHLRWTIDYAADMEFTKRVYAEIYPHKPDFSWKDVLDLVNQFPDLQAMNSHIIRNEGLKKSEMLES